MWSLQETKDKRPPWTIHPKAKFLGLWNALSAIFIVNCAFFLPFQMAFSYSYGFDGATSDEVRDCPDQSHLVTLFHITLGILGCDVAGHGHVLLF